MKNMKLIAIICGLTLSVSSLRAGSCSSDKDDSDKSFQRRSMMKEKRAGGSQYNNGQQRGAFMPPPCNCASSQGFVFSMEYLIMRAYQPNLAYAFEKKNQEEFVANAWTARQIGDVSSVGNIVRPDRTFRPGFKVNIGWNTEYDLWDLQSEWMYYHNKSVTSKSTDDMILSSFANVDEGFVPYWTIPLVNNAGAGSVPVVTTGIGVATYTQLRGTWLLNYNMINLELGRSLYLTKTLTVRPHFGLQNGWIHQKAEVEYARSLNIIPTNGLGTRPLDQRAILSNRFWGVGFRTGFDGSWELGAGFSLLGKIAGSLLSGNTHARRIQDSAENATLGGIGTSHYIRIHNSEDKIRDFVPGLDTSLGITWGTCMGYDDSMYFGLSLNWESIYWWGQFRLLQPEYVRSTISGGNTNTYRSGYSEKYPFVDSALNIEGFTAKAQFNF